MQSNPAEKALIEMLPAILEWLELLGDNDRREVRQVLRGINRGQALDLDRFGAGDVAGALATAVELDEYTYLVAGCVGEFWTRICFAHIRNFAARPENEMLTLGKSYGMGLQLV